MATELPLFPEQASTFAPATDALYFFLVGISVFFTVLITALIVFFAIKYRRGSNANRVLGNSGTLLLELTWILIPLAISMVIFFWGTSLYFTVTVPPENVMKITVVGKQWMWKFKHPAGNREVNELHVPVGQPIQLEMISEDVIHDVFIPAFRVKNDVLPGRTTTLWFEATRVGSYHLFCAEYCGTDHSKMIGKVHVLEQEDYEKWLAGNTSNLTAEESGKQLFQQFGCATCHEGGGAQQRGPALAGIFGKEIPLANGEKVVADAAYLRRSIVNPGVDIVAGFQNIMPTYQDRISEEEMIDLIAYIRSLSTQ